MSSWLASAAAISFLRKRESRIEPFKRTVELAEQEQQKAVKDLEDATNELMKLMAERIAHEP